MTGTGISFSFNFFGVILPTECSPPSSSSISIMEEVCKVSLFYTMHGWIMNEVTCSVTSAHVEHKKDWKCRWYGLLLHIFFFLLLLFLCSNDCTLVFLWRAFSSMLTKKKTKKQLPGSHRSQTVVWNHIHAVSSFSSSAVRLCTVIVPLSLTKTEQNRTTFLKFTNYYKHNSLPVI